MFKLQCVVLIVAINIAMSASSQSSDNERIQSILDKAALYGAHKYNCTVAIAFKNESVAVSTARGTSNFDTGRPAQASDKFAWGSGTKPLTGASILKLVSEGKFGLDDPIGPLVNPYLAYLNMRSGGAQNFTSIDQLYGDNASKVTVRALLSMTSGIPDFDTATPKVPPTDSLRAALYAHPSRSMSPTELLSVPWIAKGHLEDPGKISYSSTNFILLGLILARFSGAVTWSALNQTSFVSQTGREEFEDLKFALEINQSLSDFTLMHGYDRTHYNNQTTPHDVYDVAGVFAGYTASDIVMDVADAAQLSWEVYGKNPTIAPLEYTKLMIPTSWYGLATFNLTRDTGFKPPLGTAYGHLGATYGFQSVFSYHPHLDFALAIATNIETDDQVQPGDVMCSAYSGIAEVFTNFVYNCTYTPNGYFGGNCSCQTVN
eukprot:m.23967 g.23967  ORF g.23967 m.23967 type:complete len:432 (-) comp14431_c0_seq1:675-1970(-)